MGEVGIVGTLFSTLILSEAEAFDCEMSQLLLQFPNQVFIIPKIAFSFH